jgi:hypothetical protein
LFLFDVIAKNTAITKLYHENEYRVMFGIRE